MTTESEESVEKSDQLPEEAPAEVAEDDTPGDAREEAESPGAADESDPDQATGHPENAG